MVALVEEKLKEVAELCGRRGVVRLSLFGSAATGGFNEASRDLDFLVEFSPSSPVDHADSYFGLQEDLERLFGVPVELVEPGPIRNPYFKRAVERTQVVLYAAA